MFFSRALASFWIRLVAESKSTSSLLHSSNESTLKPFMLFSDEMGKGKGKGRAIGLEDSDKAPIADQSPHSSSSILERVTASAASLAQSAFANPTSNELSDAASVALTSTGKGQQLGGSSSSWAESSRPYQQTRLPTLQRQSLPSFRAGNREEHIRDAESEFSSFLDRIDSFTPSSEPYAQADSSQGQAINKRLEGIKIRTDARRDQTGQVLYDAVNHQQQHDGDAVLSILSDPSSTPDELEALQVKEEDFSWKLTDQQVSRLRVLVDDYFSPADKHISMSAQHPLNLVPAMVTISTKSDAVPLIDTSLEESYMYFGRGIPRDTVRQMWMEQWEGVLTRYTDEVWGDLLPLIAEARGEVQAMKEDQSGNFIEQSKALRRLKLVLDHVRKL